MASSATPTCPLPWSTAKPASNEVGSGPWTLPGPLPLHEAGIMSVAERPVGPFAGAASGVDAVTADGRVVRIRPARADDAARLTALYERGGSETLYRRF